MTGGYYDAISLLRNRDMGPNGEVGRNFLAYMLEGKILCPEGSYEEWCKHAEESLNIRYKCKSEDLKAIISKTAWKEVVHDEKIGDQEISVNLSDMECAVLYAIESAENHDQQENGRTIIQNFIEDIYQEYVKRVVYGQIVNNMENEFGLLVYSRGSVLLASMVYKKYLQKDISSEELYSYIAIKKSVSEVLDRWEQEASLKVNSDNGWQSPKTFGQIAKEVIEPMILEETKESSLLKEIKSAEEVASIILEKIK